MRAFVNKYQKQLKNTHFNEWLFLMAYMLYLFRGMWQSTMFPKFRIIVLVCVPVAALFLVLKIIIYDSYTQKSTFMIVITAIFILIICWRARTIIPFMWMLLILGSKNVDFKQILRIYVLVVGAVLVLAFFSSLLGVIENLQFMGITRTINAFGIIYPTDFAAHVFYILMVLFYLNQEKIRTVHYTIVLVIAGLLYYFCDARLDSICIVSLVCLFGMGTWIESSYKVSRNLKHDWDKVWGNMGVFIVPVAAGVSILTTLLFQSDNSFWNKFNTLLSNRLQLGKNMYQVYGFELFGQWVEMIGYGGTTGGVENYNYVDCSYMQVLLIYGIVGFFIIVVLYMLCCKKNKDNHFLLYCIALVAINSMVAHHLIQVEYNPWLLSLFSSPCIAAEHKSKENALLLR